ncbi:tetratricopeptide (TPR) repeat protein [Actinoplanes lutulentus]|uniref:Tetratricopeptide repeat protein n=1 Tax=Actinoplanes lutulentus TaxID=1287878 RepID=A0A327Z5H5_9ACTN|nr:hypothetical protein [Actinoplanes lutulentus]MBB2949136.1 tetratricopeptide (TPR) repeat protein [Actinoplanes lutulentus]RAK31457.1 hypothetical protein B0I29_115264 [Actinoplanes lutulentus]
MRRVLVRLGLAAALAATLLTVAAVLIRPRPTLPAAQSAAPPTDSVTDRIARAQQRLADVPGDWPAWAALGSAYLEQARITADPALYPKAEQAARTSLSLRRDGNSDALIVLGALANARHDFPLARDLAAQAIKINTFNPLGYAVRADALTQLGDAPGATAAVQRMLDLRPGMAAFTRASYDLELRGLLTEATDLMRLALAGAVDPHDIAFCRTQLGDLAFGRGDLDTATAEYTAAIAASAATPSTQPEAGAQQAGSGTPQAVGPAASGALHGMARVKAARGDLAGAIADYGALTARLPATATLLEYADLLRLAGRGAEADAQLELAAVTERLFTANGGTDGLVTAALALARNRPADAVAAARAEWSRRKHPDVADTLAWSLHAAGRDAEALSYARRAVAGGAHPASYAYHLGMIQLSLGQRAAARTEIARALSTNPHFSPVDAPTARRALSGLTSTGGIR